MTAPLTVRVHLADAPTDVLVWLVDHDGAWVLPAIVEGCVPDDAATPVESVSDALALLRTAGYVNRYADDGGGWVHYATEDGRAAVAEARALTVDRDPS